MLTQTTAETLAALLHVEGYEGVLRALAELGVEDAARDATRTKLWVGMISSIEAASRLAAKLEG